MALLSLRDIENKAGYPFNAGSLSSIFAEDILLFKGALENPHETGSEVFIQTYNLTTSERDALTLPVGSSGYLIYNTTVGSPQYYNGTAWSNIGAAALDIDNPTLTQILYSDGEIGSVIDIFDAGSVISVFTYTNGSLTSVDIDNNGTDESITITYSGSNISEITYA